MLSAMKNVTLQNNDSQLEHQERPFPDHAKAVVRSIRGAFSELLTSVGSDPQAPQEFGRRFKLNKNLAWKISKIIQTDDPSVALTQMPGTAGINIFLKSMESAGASSLLLDTARETVQEYEDLIRVHSGDRATLEIMASELSSEGRKQRDEYHRKQLFQGASYVWGVQAKVNLKVGLVGPGSKTGLLDFASVNALIDFRRFRRDVTWVMASRRGRNDDGSKMKTSASEPIDLQFSDVDQAPLMPDFCSQPLPELRRVPTRTGNNFELVEGPVGNVGARTCVVGAIQRGIPYCRTPENEWGEHTAISDTPAELMILDLFFHESFSFAIPPEASFYSELTADAPYPARGRENNRLPLTESLQDLGTGPLLVATPEVPRYRQMVQTVFDRMGWSPKEFHGFRMRMVYPPCPTALVLRYRLPEKPV
jgi:hypothetical protein